MIAFAQQVPDGTVLNIRVQPRSSRSGVDGVLGEALKVRLHSAPVEGKANQELIETLADAFDLAKSSVRFKGGETSKTKRLLLTGLTVADVERICREKKFV